ncbi:MAG: dynamin family protein [Pseudomonadota bacterium]
MELTPTEQLDEARRLVEQIDQSLATLLECAPDSCLVGEIESSIGRLRTELGEAKQRLQSPTFSIATIGTTSSGKSTLVNAMIGRRLAPIEADEMSAGILTFIHSERSKLVVEETANACWECGEWPDIEDEEIYKKLRAKQKLDGFDGIMTLYHGAENKSEVVPPRIRVEGPLLPVVWHELIGLPGGVGLEVVDLPGLKNIQNRATLKLIQDRVLRSFSVVVLDYSQTDDGKRKDLLVELKRVVEELRGRTDTMMFVLNRVDLQTAEDTPLEYRLEILAEEIARALALESTPKIFPLQALCIYYTQCAWGASSPPQGPVAPKTIRGKLLESFLDDCGKIIRRMRKTDPEAKEWFSHHEDDFQDLADEHLKTLLYKYAYEWSYAGHFWEEMRLRVAESFRQVVIFPAVSSLLAEFDKFSRAFKALVQINMETSAKQIEADRSKLKKAQSEILPQLETRRENFRSNVKRASSLLKEGTDTGEKSATDILGEGFRGFVSSVDQVKDDLAEYIIMPVKEAFEKGISAFDLDHILSESPFIPSDKARELALAYEGYVRCGMKGDAIRLGLLKKANEDDAEAVKDLAAIEKSARRLYQRMREILSHAGELLLQAKAGQLEGALVDLLNREMRSIQNLVKHHLSDSALDPAVLLGRVSLLDPSEIKLPETLFELPQPVAQETIESTEKIGVKKVTRSYTTGTCFNKKTHYHDEHVDQYGTVRYVTLGLPDVGTMAQHWVHGMELGSQDLWDKLTDWISNSFDNVIVNHTESINRAVIMLDDIIGRRLESLRKNEVSEQLKWEMVATHLSDADEAKDHLSLFCVSEGNSK